MSHSSVAGKYLHKLEKQRDLFVDSIFKRHESISKMIPFDEYLPEHEVFIMKDGSLGAAFKIALLEHETMSATEIVEIVDSFQSLLKLPSNCTLQINMYQRELSGESPVWKNLSEGFINPNPVSKSIFDKKIKGFSNAENGKVLFERVSVLSIRYFPESLEKSKKVKSLLASSETFLLTTVDEFVKDLKEFKAIIETYKLSSKIGLESFNAQDLLDIARAVFNPESYKNFNFPRYKENESLSEQVVFSEGHKSYEGIDCEGVMSRTVSLKGIPGKCWPGMMTELTLPDFPFQYSINITFPERDELMKKLNTKIFFLNNPISAKAQRTKEDAVNGLRRLEYGDQGVTCTIFGVVYGKTEDEINTRIRKLINVFQNQFETAALADKTVGFGQVLCSLPFTFDPQIQESLQRHSTMFMKDVVNFLPVFDSFRGTRDPIQLFVSRENTPVPFSPFSNPISNHSVVIADTGSGKSAFVCDILQSAKKLDPEPLVFVVDKKTSYLMLNRVFDGDITIFDPNEEMPFSPFRGQYDEAKVSFLTNLLISAIALTSSKFEMEAEHLTAISKSLRTAYNNKYAQRGLKYVDGKLITEESDDPVYITIDNVVQELGILKAQPEYEKSSDLIDDLIKKLRPFYGDGPYARYFEVKDQTARKESNFYVYDIEGLTDPVLSELISMSIFEEIRMTINRPENEGRMSIIVAEELGQNGDKNPTAAKYWADFAETMRKKGAWLIGLAPNPKIFFETSVGQSFVAAAEHFFFLKLSPDNAAYLHKNSDLVDETMFKILKSLDTVKDQYADIFYTNKNKTISGVFRFPQTTVDKWLAPTNQKDFQKAKKALAKFENEPLKAFEYLVEKNPIKVSRGGR